MSVTAMILMLTVGRLTAPPPPPTPIVGGEDASGAEWAGVASIEVRGALCTGVLVDRRVLLTAAGVTLLLGAFVVAVPMPFATVAQGVVWIPEQAQLRAGTDGFIVSLQARHGERVEAGQVLATLEDHRLQVEGQRLESALEGLDADLYEVMVRDPVKAHNVEADIERTRAELARIQERQALLSLRAGVSGSLR